jgi:hypothetical protein
VASQERCKRPRTQATAGLRGGGASLGDHLLVAVVTRWLGQQLASQVLQPPQRLGVMVSPRQPLDARSSTAQTRLRRLCSPGSRPITFTLRRVSPKVRSIRLEWRMRLRCSVPLPPSEMTSSGSQAPGRSDPAGSLAKAAVDSAAPGPRPRNTARAHPAGDHRRLQRVGPGDGLAEQLVAQVSFVGGQLFDGTYARCAFTPGI